MLRISTLLHGEPVTSEDVSRLQSKLMFDRMPVWDRYISFFVLVALSTIIAAYGVTRNSAATVIGAMIVAPLMTPIMAISLGAITGDTRNIIRSTLVVFSGVALVVGLSYLLAVILPGELNVMDNAQVITRTAPRDIDLIIALAAGAAGAFVVCRSDVSDALPGVAIAVSLVPPLSVVGICLAARQPALAWDAFLLFLTNFFAIVAAGLAVLAIMGYGGVHMVSNGRRSRLWATIVIVVAVLVIAVPLFLAGYYTTRSENMRRDAKAVADEWVLDTGYEVDMVEADFGELDITISGVGTRPDLEELLSELEYVAPGVTVRVKVDFEENLEGKTGT